MLCLGSIEMTVLNVYMYNVIKGQFYYGIIGIDHCIVYFIIFLSVILSESNNIIYIANL